ncbi:MAG: DUF3179 domain-containing protein [Halobacteriales archaeon]
MDGSTRRAFLAATGAAALAGCAGLRSRGSEAGSTTASPTSTEAPTGPPLAEETLPLPMSPKKLRENVVSGGQPKDGIPAIDDPTFEPADAVGDRLSPDDPVFGLAHGDAVKAYPQPVLVWHEICNDVVDGDPISVTYCPLTGTVLGFDRGSTTFGVSGRLLNSNLVMYDRATERWWPQVLGTSIMGPWSDREVARSLRERRLVWTTWKRWRERHPDTEVLTRDTGYARNYGSDPYGAYTPRKGYYALRSGPFGDPLFPNERFEPKRIVLGARTPEGAAAFPKDVLRENGVMAGTIGDTPVVAIHDPGLDTGYVYRNPGERSFERSGDRIEGPEGTHAPDALPLERVHTFDAMWFAWAGFYPETDVYV